MGGAVSSGRDNNELIDNLMVGNYIKSRNVEQVFRALDRADYMTPDCRDQAYKDLAWRSGYLHMSAPCIYSKVMEGLELKPGLSFLNVGAGTGYLSTLVGLIIGSSGVNHGVEVFPQVVDYSVTKLNQFIENSPTLDDFDFCEPKFYNGNGLCLSPQQAPYDRVYCGAGCPSQYQNYFQQLIKIGGILVMPLNDNLVQVRRVSATAWRSKTLLNVSFASLREPVKGQPQEMVKLDEQSPARLQILSRACVRHCMRARILSRAPELRDVPREVKPQAHQPRRICIPLDDDSDVENLNMLHDLDAASGAHEMNALLSLVLSMGQNRVAGALRFGSRSGSDVSEEDSSDFRSELSYGDDSSGDDDDDDDGDSPPYALESANRSLSSSPTLDRDTNANAEAENNTSSNSKENSNLDSSQTSNPETNSKENTESNTQDSKSNSEQNKKANSKKSNTKSKRNSKSSPKDNSKSGSKNNSSSNLKGKSSSNSKDNLRSSPRAKSSSNSKDKSNSGSKDNLSTPKDKSSSNSKDNSNSGSKDNSSSSPKDNSSSSSKDSSPKDGSKSNSTNTDRPNRPTRTVFMFEFRDNAAPSTSNGGNDNKNSKIRTRRTTHQTTEVEILLEESEQPGTSMEWEIEDRRTEEREKREHSSDDETTDSNTKAKEEKRQKVDSGIGEENTASGDTSPTKTDKSTESDAASKTESSGDGQTETKVRRRQKRGRGQMEASSSSAEEEEGPGRRVRRRGGGRGGGDARRVALSIAMKRAVKELPLPYPLKKYINYGRCFQF